MRKFRRPWEAIAQHDKSFHDMATNFVRASHNGSLNHCGMFDQRAFHFTSTDAIARADDDVIRTPNEPVISVFVFVGFVAGEIPRPAPCGLRKSRFLPVAKK